MADYELVWENRASIVILKALMMLRKGSVVLLPCNCCPILFLVVLKSGLRPQLLNVDRFGEVIPQDLLKLARQGNVSSVIYIRPFGVVFNREELFNNIKSIDSKIFIIDDRCLSIPKLISEHSSFSADLTLYSTGYSKYVDFGFGGYGFLRSNSNYAYDYVNKEKDKTDIFMKDVITSSKNNEIYTLPNDDWFPVRNTSFDINEYFDLLVKERKAVDCIKNNINEVYNSILISTIRSNIDTWRYTIVNISDEIGLKIFNSVNSKDNLFCSYHYPNLSMVSDNNCIGVETRKVNLFNDRRYSVDRAALTANLINKIVKEFR